MAQPASLPSIGNNPLPFRLVDLPPELFSLTCSFLDDESLLNLRQASRSTHGNAWHTFGERCFSTLHIFLHPVSLGMFLEIASHAKLSKHVKEVSICLESIDNVYYDKTPEGCALEEQHSKDNKELPYLNRLREMERGMRVADLDHLMLCNGLSKLVNLQYVILGRAWPSVDRTLRIYQFPGELPILCGNKSLLGKEGEPWTIKFGLPDTRSLRGLNIAMRALDDVKLADIKLTVSIWTPFAPSLDSMDHQLSTQWETYGLNKIRILLLESSSFGMEWHGKLLRASSKLQRLVIWTHTTPRSWGGFEFFTNVTFSQSGTWPNLQKLSLCLVQLRDHIFASFLRRHQKSLVGIEIYSCKMIDNDTWMEALHTMKTMPRLESILLRYLYSAVSGPFTSENFNRYYAPEELRKSSTVILRRQCIIAGLETFIRDYRTVRDKLPILDFRQVNALLEGQIRWNGSAWQVVLSGSRHPIVMGK
jgi:hypothetical protein